MYILKQRLRILPLSNTLLFNLFPHSPARIIKNRALLLTNPEEASREKDKVIDIFLQKNNNALVFAIGVGVGVGVSLGRG